MAKRFTETDKWKDRWFRSLRAEFKLAWLYLLDNCDQAGVIELDNELAEFQIGNAIDWDAFLSQCDGRIARLKNGKLYICKFIEFQYGELSKDCRAHNPVFQSLERNRVSKEYSKGIQRVQDKDKDKDIVKDKDKDIGEVQEGGDSFGWIVPSRLDTPAVRDLLTRFEAMRRKIGKPIKDVESSSTILNRFDDPDHLCYALEICISNQYQGLKPEYRPSDRRKDTKQVIAIGDLPA